MRPLRVCATARLDSGPTTPMTSTPQPLCGHVRRQVRQRARRRRVAGDDDELRAALEQHVGDLPAEGPQLVRACGRRRESAPSRRGTGSPPAAARRAARAGPSARRRRSRRRRSGRCAAGADGTGRHVRRGAPRAPTGRGLRYGLPLPTDSIVSLSLSAISFASPPPSFIPLAARTTPDSSAGEQEHEPDVLDGALPALLAAEASEVCVDPAHRAIRHVRPPGDGGVPHRCCAASRDGSTRVCDKSAQKLRRTRANDRNPPLPAHVVTT